MCQECGYYPCHTRCPNAKELKALFMCDECGLDITELDDYVTLPGKRHYHLDCLGDMDGYQVADLLGVEITYGSDG